jgi:hypothetical protein
MLGGVVCFCTTSGLILGWAEPRRGEGVRGGRSLTEIHAVVGPWSKQLQYTAGADTLVPCRESDEGRQPHVVAISTRKRISFVSSLSRSTSNANAMSGILRKRPPSAGGTPTEPSSCKIHHRRCHFLWPADDPQPRNNGSSMSSRCCWTLRRNLPTHFHPSSRV